MCPSENFQWINYLKLRLRSTLETYIDYVKTFLLKSLKYFHITII